MKKPVSPFAFAGWGCAIVVAAFAASWALGSVLQPARLDNNALAYLALRDAAGSGSFRKVISVVPDVLKQADDGDLLKLTGMFTRSAEMALKTGVETFDETDSPVGALKSFVYGILHPADGFSGGLGLVLDSFSIESVEEKVESRYEPQITSHIERRNRAELVGRVTFWGVLIVGFAALFLTWPGTGSSEQIRNY